MLFGYLIAQNLRLIVKIVARLPPGAKRAFAATLDAATRPFHQINYWGSRADGRVFGPDRMIYATVHFDHHKSQLTLDHSKPGPASRS